MSEPTPEKIAELRSNFLSELENKGTDCIHPADLNRIQKNDDWLRRFLLHVDSDMKLALQMMWNTVAWRKEQKANELTAAKVRIDYLETGAFFAHGRDKDGCILFIFKCKRHTKGSKDFEELKKCVIYWLERLEREEDGKPITLFFDMDGCGISNMDMEFTGFLINTMKEYYPYLLNYIIILEMAWILNAAFKIIKSWLPEKAKQKIKMVKKNELKAWVPVDQQLTCWGGTDDYTFEFKESNCLPTGTQAPTHNGLSKKVHFAERSQMSDTVENAGGDAEHAECGLVVRPSTILTFNKEGNELVSNLELQNNDRTNVLAFKMKTTSPEKFRVRPSNGTLNPGDRAMVSVTLQPGFQLGGLTRDKFLIMSLPVDSSELSGQDLTDLWKNTSGKSVTQHRLSCTQGSPEIMKNGNAIPLSQSPTDNNQQLKKLTATLTEVSECQAKLHDSLRTTQYLQIFTLFLTLFLGLVLVYVMRNEFRETTSSLSCERQSMYNNQ